MKSLDELKDSTITENQYNDLLGEVLAETPLTSSYFCRYYTGVGKLKEELTKHNIKVSH